MASVGGGQTVMLSSPGSSSGRGSRPTSPVRPATSPTRAGRLAPQWHEFEYSERRLLTPGWRLPRARAAAARFAEGRRLAALAVEVGADIVHTGALIPHVDAQAAGPRFKARTLCGT